MRRTLKAEEEQPNEVQSPMPEAPDLDDSATPLNERLEAAANLLLEQLTPTYRDLALDFAKTVHKVPVWQFLLGCLMANQQSGMFSAPYFDPAWRDTTQIVNYKKICPVCNRVFTPKRVGQVYCSNECGSSTLKRPNARINP